MHFLPIKSVLRFLCDIVEMCSISRDFNFVQFLDYFGRFSTLKFVGPVIDEAENPQNLNHERYERTEESAEAQFCR
jgi:hypothetical protein